jgi:DNA repair protein RadA/Sms
MAKPTSLFMCNQCGNEFPKWVGQCPACKEWNTLTEVTSFTKTKTSKNKPHQNLTTITPEKALTSQKNYTYSSTITELDRVLGQGFTKGGVYLIAGQPGIGKSTLLTQLAINLKKPILYVCSEENPSQVATRISRLTKEKTSHIELLNTSSVNQILDSINKNKNLELVIVDSIQSVYLEDNPATSGSITQIRDSATYLIQTAKDTNIPIILVGHVTKEGNLAGPKLLEHMVDTVLELSGDRQNLLRFLRSHKNRFGPTDETGIFTMTSNGLEEVKDPSRLLLEDRLENTPGSVLTLVMEGTRPITIEVQALVVPTSIPIPRRIAKGISISRLQLLCAILTKHLHLPLGDKDVFVNITGGMNITEPGVDLGLALAIISSTKDKPLPTNSICFGEVGLLGEIRKVTFQDKRLKEAKALGYKSIISPDSFKHLRQIKI